jgi:glucosamine--fructose-6-phosphate aminotransferase (isomerizing)
MTHLEDEIRQQSSVVEELLLREHDSAIDIADAIRMFNPSFVMIAARGTSDNAARYAQYVFGALAGLPVALAAPSIHTIYDAAPRLDRALVIGISQSGQSADVRRVISDAREQGALTLAITNGPESPLALAAHHHLWLGAGDEHSVAATKTYTASLATVALLVVELLNDDALRADLRQLPVHMTATLQETLAATGRVQRYRYMDHLITIGRGFNFCTAFEINLKVKELCYIIGDAYSEADFRHGPIATIEHGSPVMVIAPQGRTLPVVSDLVETLAARGAELIVISNDAAMLERAQSPLKVPALPEWLSPVVTVLPGQVFGWQLAAIRGLNVDRPRGLNKVTITQ